jgi:hypothetical protein
MEVDKYKAAILNAGGDPLMLQYSSKPLALTEGPSSLAKDRFNLDNQESRIPY